jgi:dolichol-phosphate mannosyltransferase
MFVADVIVPVYNEEDILEDFYRRVMALDLDLRLIFIDNASTDRSLQILQSFPGVDVIRHDRNEGYGSSLVDGILHGENDNIIIIDADCEYPPEVIPAILTALEDHDVVYTSRFVGRVSSGETNMPYLKYLGNKIISSLYNGLFRQNVTDLYTGCKGFKRRCIEGIDFERRGFEHVLELSCRLSQRGYRILDVPIVFEPRHTGSSKMNHVSETAKFLYLLLRYRLGQ